LKKLLILLATIFCFSITNVYANTIYSIDVDTYIDKNGDAEITETWNVKGTDGTEWYHPFRDLESGHHEITDYTVTMDGSPLTKKNWDVYESLSQKAGYYGINYTNEGIELCFGKSDFDNHTFVLKYKVKNFIYNTDDAQVMYWTFFPKFQNVDFQKYTLTIKSYYEFPDDLDLWSFGHKSYYFAENGVASFTNSEDSDMNDSYVVALAKFPLNTFDTTNTNTNFQSFNDILSAGNEGTFEYDYGESTTKLSTWQKIINFIKGVFWLIPMVIIGIFSAIFANKNGYGYKDNKTIDKKTLPNFRDIPCNKNIYYANALLFLNNFEYKETNILGAIILKWVKQEKVGFIKQDVGIFKKEQNCLDLRKQPTFDISGEEKLFNIMYEASGDGILEPKEFGKWAKRNYSKFFDIFKGFKDAEITRLRGENHIYTRKDKNECKKGNVMDDTIYEDSKRLYGLKKFLQEFSSINTRETIEVHIWDEYLMFAYLFGIADKVAKQLKNLYPELMEQQQNMDYTTIMMINSFSTTTVNAASSARSSAEHYSAGGGGFGVGGGGFGAGGGGGFSGGGSR
jgi:uncharacterized membrane protein YgcG